MARRTLDVDMSKVGKVYESQKGARPNRGRDNEVTPANPKLDNLYETGPDEDRSEDGEERPERPWREPKPVSLTDDELKSLADKYASEIEANLEARAPLEGDWEEWHRLYNARPLVEKKNYPMDGASNVVVPLAGIYTNKLVAKFMRSLTALEPHWSVTQRNRMWAEHAKPTETYLDFCRSDMWDQYAVIKPWVIETVKLGTSILGMEYRADTFRRYDADSGTTVEAGRSVGPRPFWVPREDFICPIGFNRVNGDGRAPWVAARKWFSWGRLKELAWANEILGLEELRGNPDDASESRIKRRKDHQATDEGSVVDPKFGLWGPWVVWFAEDLDDDGYPEEYAMMLHVKTRTVMRLKPNPYVSAMRPFVVGKFIELEGEFDGVGVPQLVKDFQEEASTIHNERRDNAHLANIRMYKGRKGSVQTDSIRPRNGKVISLVEMADLQEFKLSDNRQVDAYEEQVVIKLAEMVIGMNDVNQGNVTSPVGRAAATTIMAVLQEGAERSDLNIADLRAALSEQGIQVCELFQTHGLPAPDDPGSPEQLFGMETEDAAKVRELLGQQDNMRGLIRVKLNASTAAVNREVEKQTNVQLFGMVSQYTQQMLQIATAIVQPQLPPQMAEILARGAVGMDGMMKKTFGSFGAFDMEQVLVADVIQQLQAQPPQPAQQALPPPGANGEMPPEGAMLPPEGSPPPDPPPGPPVQ